LQQNLKIIRAKKSFSRDAIANLLHISPQAYGKIERGDTHLTVERLQEIADIFGVSKQYLEEYDGSDEKFIFAHTTNDNHTLSLIVTQINENQEKVVDMLASQLQQKDEQIRILQSQVNKLIGL
jgi:transcriptional regulator with XRE-family HTH domain